MKAFYKQNHEIISLKKLVKKSFFLLVIISLDFFYPNNLFTKNFTNLEFTEKKIKKGNKKFELSKTWTKYSDDINTPSLWEKVKDSKKNEDIKIIFNQKKKITKINSLNRSIIFNENRVGPDISWMFPSGFKWSEIYKFDISARGHNTKIPDPPKKNFFGWNDGDAVGLISYQFLHFEKSSFGFNLGVRSIYEGDGALGGSTSIGEGMSAGFRWDYELSNTSGIAFGGEQLLHFDGLTDTGRNFYLTASKAWWSGEYEGKGIFPLYAATAGFGTGRMAIGTVRGLCTDSLGGSGTEITHKRNLCWAPVFSLASVWNEKLSTFFEYNGRFFLLGSSIAPSQKIPIRGTFALILSDHIDNYKFHNSDEMNWVFQLSLGF